MIKAVIFDLGSTLIKEEPWLKPIIEEDLKKLLGVDEILERLSKKYLHS